MDTQDGTLCEVCHSAINSDNLINWCYDLTT